MATATFDGTLASSSAGLAAAVAGDATESSRGDLLISPSLAVDADQSLLHDKGAGPAPPLKVPGAAAPTVHIEHLWNSQLRWVLSSDCGDLKRFIYSSFSSSRTQAGCEMSNHPSRAVWPLPLPHPHVGTLSSKNSALQRALNCMVLVLNWLHLGKPKRCPSDYVIDQQLSGEQRGIIGRLSKFFQEFLDVGPISSVEMGRAAGKVESIEETLSHLSKSLAALSKQSGSGKKSFGPRKSVPEAKASLLGDVVLAKPIESDRLKFSGVPKFDPGPLLDSTSRKLYEDPLRYSVPPAESQVEPPRVHVRGKRSEILKLLRSLDASGRLAIFEKSATRVQHRAGLFALLKDAERDRLILDSRPSNVLEPPLSKWTQTMGSIMPLLDFYIPPSKVLVAGGEDLKDFYYYYKVSSSRSCRNAIAFDLSRAEAEQFAAFKGLEDSTSNWFSPALQTMAMGDINAVEYGQQSHMALALQQGMKLTEMVFLRGRLPRSAQSWTMGIVIDDLIFLEMVDAASPYGEITNPLADSMVTLYKQVGLETNDKKRFRNVLHSKFWGASLDGAAGTIRAQLERTIPMGHLTSRLARLGYGERKLLEIIAGAWTAIVQTRRRCMCLLDRIFSTIQEHPYGEVFKLDPGLIAELWTVVLLCPLFCTDLRCPVHPKLHLVDASNDWKAEVVTDVNQNLAEELARQKLTKPMWSKLLSPVKAWKRSHGLLSPHEEVPNGEAPMTNHFLWTETVKTRQFELVDRQRVRGSPHINLSELEAALRCEARHARSHPNSKQLLGSDSQVVLGALLKGRSSSKAINERLRRALPTLLGYNTYSCLQYISTGDNVADDPTRDRDCRSPLHPGPPWLAELEAGVYESFDALLATAGLDDLSIARVPDEAPNYVVPVPSTTHRQEARAHFAQARPSRTGRDHPSRNRPPVSNRVRAQPWLPKRRLDPSAVEFLKTIPTSQFVVPRSKKLDDLLWQPGHLDLFSGSRRAARALAEKSGTWVLTFDLMHSWKEDLLQPEVQNLLTKAVGLKVFLLLTAGPVCSSFSRAVRPAVRSSQCPYGLQNLSANMKRKVADGNAFSLFLASLVEQALKLNMVVWVENPSTSYLWKLDEWQRLAGRDDTGFFLTDYCRWGMAWRKRTRFFGNHAAIHEKLLCLGHCIHQKLVGYSALHRMSWTKVAESYPPKLAHFLALMVTEKLKPPSRQMKLDVAACAGSIHRRIGEAKNPGPRPRQHRPRPGHLEDVNLVQPATQILQRRVHQKFLSWLDLQLTAGTMQSIYQQPHLQLLFLRSFGRAAYEEGEAMYVFRHLVVFLQQQFPMHRGLVADSWDLLAKWELLQPTVHRLPLPRIILDAMLSLAVSWGWWRWAAITALGYHGAMRIGEVLRSTRADLMLPEEALLSMPVCFVNVSAPKPGRRGKGRVQHARITDADTITLCRAAFCGLNGRMFLYPAAPSTYRKRWDALLLALGIPASTTLTPASIRGGGAVHLYHTSVGIPDILWRMRLRQLSTLESYLQETGASNLLQKLPVEVRRKITSCAKMYPHTLRLLSS